MHLIFITIVAVIFSSCSVIRDSIAFHPDKKSKIPTKDLPSYFNEVTIKTNDDERLKAFHLKHDETIEKRLVVYFHGNAGNLYHRVEWVNQLYLKGINVLIVDYRGYGGSTGSPSENGVYIDGQATIDYAIDSLGYSEDKINIIGRSIGTTVAVEVSQNRNFESLILITPLTTGREIGDVVAPIIASVAMDSFDSRSKIKNIFRFSYRARKYF